MKHSRLFSIQVMVVTLFCSLVQAQDSVGTKFNEVRIWTGGAQLNKWKRMVAWEKEERERKLNESLKMMVLPSPVVKQTKDGLVRNIEVVTIVENERYPIEGTLKVSFGKTKQQFTVKKSDVIYGVYSVEVAEPKQQTELKVQFDTELGKRLEQTAKVGPAEERRWGDYVRACLDTLVERGTDHYGTAHTPLLMSVIDVRTMDSPEKPELVDSLVRFEGRLHRRGERGSNLWNDQPTLRAMYWLSQRTGEEKYADAADAYIKYALEHCRKDNGLLVWGSHIHWDCYRDRAGGDQGGRGPHEILIFIPVWEEMYRLDPAMVRREAELIWKWHVCDKKTGQHNRHDDGQPGADFSFSGGSFVLSFAFAHSVTPDDQEWLRRARLVADWHWGHRHPETNLIPFVPSDDYIYGRVFASAVCGPHAVQLLRSYELTGEEHFRDLAVAYLKAYNKYGWDKEAQTYIGMLNLDGTPTTLEQLPQTHRDQVPRGGKEPDPAYSVPPIGPVDVWPTTIFPLDFPLLTAQANLYAYELNGKEGRRGDEELLQAAKRWAKVIEGSLAPDTGWTFRKTLTAALPKSRETHGTYAQNYGRAISFFVHLYRATGKKRYLELAEQLARDAVDKLYVETEIALVQGKTRRFGIFRGHPAKPYYEAANGVGFLLYALLELDEPEGDSFGAF